MGSCAFRDKSLREIGQENQLLSDSNICILKFLSLYYIKHKQPGMAVKLINIKLITKAYYNSVAAERQETLKEKKLLDPIELGLLERTLMMEMNQLQRANAVLNEIFYSLTSYMFLLTPSVNRKISEYSKDADLIYYYDELKARCIELNSAGSGISSLFIKVNNGDYLSREQKEVLNSVSKVTSHVANNPERRISYLFQAEHLTNSKDSFSRMNSRKRKYRFSKKKRG